MMVKGEFDGLSESCGMCTCRRYEGLLLCVAGVCSRGGWDEHAEAVANGEMKVLLDGESSA